MKPKFLVVLETYQKHSNQYMTDTELHKLAGLPEETRSSIPQVRKTLMKQGFCFSVKTGNKGIRGNNKYEFKYLYQVSGEGFYRCDDPVKKPTGPIDWKHMEEARLQDDMRKMIRIIEQLNQKGYFADKDIAKRLGIPASKVKRMIHALLTNKNIKHHSRGELYKRTYRILSYTPKTNGGLRRPITIPEPTKNSTLLSKVFS